jgi:excisionase family DNA binding protein
MSFLEGARIVKRKQLAEILQVSERTITEWVSQRKIPFIRINKQIVRFDVNEVLKSKTINPQKITSL